MMFVVTPLVVAGLLALGWNRERRWWLAGLISGLLAGGLLAWWGIAHVVFGERTSALGKAIFARPYLPGVAGPLVGLSIAAGARAIAFWRGARAA
jgi:hypothetical protein